MQLVLAIAACTDAFEREWADIAESAGAEAAVADSVAELAPLGRACGVLIGVGGAEEEAPALVADARAAGATAVAVVGAATDHRVASLALRAGAADYFALPADLELLRSWAADRVQRWQARERSQALAEYERERYDFSQLVGESNGIVAALERAAKIIPRANATVLITGETGTGKGLLAQAVHYNGPRAAEPFVEVNCTALPATLLESELFGYEKGAFTDASTSKPGLFEAAHGGTIFLDEIGDLSLELQAKLLKALEDKKVRRLGSVSTLDVDVRVIAATNLDLATAVRDGAFREDLYYRLNVVHIRLPPLRERGDDVVHLAEHFLDRLADEYDVARPTLSGDARRRLLAYPWRGNVRELRNAIERAVLLGDGELRHEDLFEEPSAVPDGAALPFPAPLEAIDRAAARAMVERCGGNKSAAAEALGISRSRLYRLLDAADEDV